MTIDVKILGGGGEVGRLAVMVRGDDTGVLLDYGVNFAEDGGEPLFPEVVTPKNIDAIVISHAHLDHMGAAPLYYISTTKPLYTSSVTKDLMKPMFEDFLHISGYYLPFEYLEVLKMWENTIPVRYKDTVTVKNVELKFLNAGHIPGSLSVILRFKESSILFTGDFNTVETQLVRAADYAEAKDVEYLIIEATYALYTHPRRLDVERRFIESVREVLEDGGIVLVPAFSLSRSQEMLCVLYRYGIEYPIYYDGMVRVINKILLGNKSFVRDAKLLEKAIRRSKEVRGWRDRRSIRGPAVIVSSSGMLKGGPSVHYMKSLCENEKNAVFLVSFQASDTPGRRVLEKGVFGVVERPVKARVEWFDFSSHCGRREILETIRSLPNLKKVIIVHSEEGAAYKLAEFIVENYGIEAIAARNLQDIVLD